MGVSRTPRVCGTLSYSDTLESAQTLTNPYAHPPDHFQISPIPCTAQEHGGLGW